jgi:hypothetical protein
MIFNGLECIRHDQSHNRTLNNFARCPILWSYFEKKNIYVLHCAHTTMIERDRLCVVWLNSSEEILNFLPVGTNHPIKFPIKYQVQCKKPTVPRHLVDNPLEWLCKRGIDHLHRVGMTSL